MEDSRNIIKAIDALTLKAGGEVVDSKNITEAIDRLKAVYDQEAIGIDKTLSHEGLAADAKAVGDKFADFGGVKFKYFVVRKDTTVDFTVGKNSRIVAFSIGAVDGIHALYTINTDSAASVTAIKMFGGELLSEEVEGSIFSITNSSVSSAIVWTIIFSGSITVEE